jgi:hypothetical protein
MKKILTLFITVIFSAAIVTANDQINNESKYEIITISTEEKDSSAEKEQQTEAEAPEKQESDALTDLNVEETLAQLEQQLNDVVTQQKIYTSLNITGGLLAILGLSLVMGDALEGIDNNDTAELGSMSYAGAALTGTGALTCMIFSILYYTNEEKQINLETSVNYYKNLEKSKQINEQYQNSNTETAAETEENSNTDKTEDNENNADSKASTDETPSTDKQEEADQNAETEETVSAS